MATEQDRKRTDYRAIFTRLKQRIANLNNQGTIAISSVQAAIAGSTRAQLESKGKITLSEAHCARIAEIIREVSIEAQLKDASKVDALTKRKLTKILSYIESLRREFENRNFGTVSLSEQLSESDKVSLYLGAAFRQAGLSPDRLFGPLTRFEKELSGLFSAESPTGRPPFAIGNLMRDLAEVYRDAGGQSLRISRGGGPRRSSFVEFAWEVLQLLPPDRRPTAPTSLSALMSWWEVNADEYLPPAECPPK